MTPTTLLLPIHHWFFAWERIVPPVYRVAATGTAAAGTTLLAASLGAHPLVALAASIPIWIGVAIAQEHDERVRLPSDPEFTRALADAVSRRPLQLRITVASGPSRVRPHEGDHFVLAPADSNGHPLAHYFISVERNLSERSMRLYVGDDTSEEFDSVEYRLRASGMKVLAERIEHASDPAADAAVIAEALAATYW